MKKFLTILFFLFALNGFTASRYWVGGGSSANWNATGPTNWSATSGGANNASVPTSSDDVFFDGSGNSASVISANITVKTLSISSGYTNTLTHNSGVELAIVGGNTGTSSTSLSMAGTFTYTLGNSRTSSINFTGNSVSITINSNKTMGDISFTGGFSTIVTSSNITSSGSIVFSDDGMNVTFNGDVTCLFFSVVQDLSAYDFSAATITATGTDADNSAGVFVFNRAGGEDPTQSLNPGTSTIKITNASSSQKTFSGGTFTYNNVWFTGVGTGTFVVTGDNTFNNFKIDTPPHVVKFQAGSTTSVSSFSVTGTSGNLITIASTTSGTFASLSKTSGSVCTDYLSIKDSHAIGGATFNAGANSTNVSGNTGWSFTGCSTSSSSGFFQILK